MSEREIREYDLNDPALMDDTPGDYDPTAEQVEVSYAPPDDGPQLCRFRLQEQVKEDKPPIYVKGTPGDSRVVVALNPKLIREDESEGYLKPLWLTSKVGRGQLNSSLGFFCLYAGNPLPARATNKEIYLHTLALFDKAGENGIDMWAWIQWLISFKKLNKEGLPVVGKDGYEEYVEIRTQKSCRLFAERNARVQLKEAGLPAGFESAADFIADAVANAWKYVDPVTFEERRIQLEIDRVLPPPNRS